jgi:hypothetical protein
MLAGPLLGFFPSLSRYDRFGREAEMDERG